LLTPGNVDELNLALRDWKPIREDASCGCRLSHQAATHFWPWRRDRIPKPRFGFNGAGRIAAANAFGMPIHSDPAHFLTGFTPSRKIFFHRQNGEQLTDAGVAYEVGIAYFAKLPADNSRGHHGPAEINFSAGTRRKSSGVHISAKVLPNCCTLARRSLR